MAENIISAKKLASGSQMSVKKKQFRWTSEMVHELLSLLKTYKTKMEYQGIDFDGDRPSQYKELKEGMAKIYKQELLVGCVEVLPSWTPLIELPEEERHDYLK